MDDPASFTLTLTLYRQERWWAQVAYSDPRSDLLGEPVRGPTRLDPEALLALQADPRVYGEALAAQLFADPDVARKLQEITTAATAADSLLRLSLCIEDSADELHALRWELLRHPTTGASLATSERVVFSRLMVSRDMRPVRLRARGELRALVAVSAPEGPRFTRTRAAPVRFAEEVDRVRSALAPLEVRTLGGPGAPLTLTRLVEGLRAGADVLYLVAHGRFLPDEPKQGDRTLVLLQDDDGDAVWVSGTEIAARLAELLHLPRLAVLLSCESAGDGAAADGEGTRASVQATLARRLADVGIPAVLAMQGQITLATGARLLPTFFRELLGDGRVDRALAVARGEVRARPDSWMPVLYTRVREGMIWYAPGFRSADDGAVWDRLLDPARRGLLLPVLGPGLLDDLWGSTFDLAGELAEQHRVPLARHEWADLQRVAQVLTVTRDRAFVLEALSTGLLNSLMERHRGLLTDAELASLRPLRLGKVLGLVADRLRELDPEEPHRLLAELGASLYITANYDRTLERALKAAGRAPQTAMSEWRPLRRRPLDPTPPEEGTPERPVVYHAFGSFSDKEDTLALTEDDTFDFLIRTVRAQLLPVGVGSALVSRNLLFLGFRLTDWRFRTLFHLIRSLEGTNLLRDRCHVAVQIDPSLEAIEDVAGARQYLKQSFAPDRIEIYFGRAEDFLRELIGARERAGGAVSSAQGGWDSDDY